MYDASIPMINYVLVTITASVLAYVTAMDINDNADTVSATFSLPSFGDAKEPEPEPEPEPEEEVPMAEAEVVPQEKPETSGSVFGGKRNARKIKKTKRNAHNSKKRKQTRNKNHSK
jgi:hypothetical protein